MVHRAAHSLILLGAFIPGIASAASVLVDPSGTIGVATIDEALATCADGDTLVLAPGDYPPTIIEDRVLTVSGAAPGVRIGSLEVLGGSVAINNVEFVGPGIALAVRGTALTGTDLNFRGGASKRSDPAILISREADATFSGVTIEDWEAASGVVVLEGASSTRFEASSFSRNHSADGGALRVDGGSVHISECAFTENQAEAWGGDIAMTGGILSVERSTFTGSSAAYGGAIGAGGGAILLIEDTEFHGTNASSAGCP